MPMHAQKKLLTLLEKAKKQQDELIKNAIKKDPKFYKNLENFLDKATKEIKSDYETKEHKNADKILDEL